ncbi:hypothetical protein ACLB2K_055153 [Fragaria x ananassa]
MIQQNMPTAAKLFTAGASKATSLTPFGEPTDQTIVGNLGSRSHAKTMSPLITMRNINFRILDMSSSSYTDIFSTSSTRTTPTVRVAREDYWGTICPSSYVPTNLNFSLFSYSYGLLNVSFWYGCSGSIAVTHACNSSFTVTYLIQTRASDLATIPVTVGACQYNILVQGELVGKTLLVLSSFAFASIHLHQPHVLETPHHFQVYQEFW